MLICKWDKLPANMQTNEVKPYWEKLRKKNFNLLWKRVFDITISSLLLIFLAPLFLILSILIKLDSKGAVFYRQVRYTQYGKQFKIHKFRSMVSSNNDGQQVTLKNDPRVTKIGKWIRKFKLDELSQLIDVFEGKMSLVGTRPEVKKYVDSYTNEYLATFLLPAGITSIASLMFKDENDMISDFENADKVYLEQILPKKMDYNLRAILEEGVFYDVKIMLLTLFKVFIKK